MNNLYWSTKKPICEGWYWMKPIIDDVYKINATIVRVREYNGALRIGFNTIRDGYLWSGPIQEPKMVK